MAKSHVKLILVESMTDGTLNFQEGMTYSDPSQVFTHRFPLPDLYIFKIRGRIFLVSWVGCNARDLYKA